MKKLISLLLLTILFISCEKEGNETPKDSGKITLSSAFFGSDNFYFSYGYSFEKGKALQVPSSNPALKADIYLDDLILPNADEMIGFIFAEEDNDYGIFKNGEFENLLAGRDFFDNYNEAVNDPGQWKIFSDTIEACQVYTFRTRENNFVKFLVTDVRKMDGLSQSDYLEVDLEYFIQRDGTTNLNKQ
jgi:hypothetical protein